MFNFRMNMPLYLMALYGSIMILVILVMRIFLKNRLPKFIFPILWAFVLVRLLIPFSMSSPISAPVPTINFGENAESVAISSNTPIEFSNLYSGNSIVQSSEYVSDYTFYPVFRKIHILTFIFAAGAVATAFILFYQRKKYFSTLKDSLLIEHNENINEAMRSMNLSHVLIFTNDYIASPIVSGILSPRIYLPAGMDFSNVQLIRHILCHEAMHIKRMDNLTKTITLIAICLHWYNPLVWIMSKYLSSDIEAACDYAVLNKKDEDERKSYACSLLSMAVTKNNSSLLYSAFSKTEVEKRIRNVLSYKKATALLMTVSILLMLSSTIVFATGGQAPFSNYLSSYCTSTECKWAVKAVITRDIYLGKNFNNRADNAIFDAMDEDNTNDPEILRDKITAALSKEFGTEKSSFMLYINLTLDEQELKSEYETHEISKDKNGFYLYKNEPVRYYIDKMLRSTQLNDKGTVDIEVIRDKMGEITDITASHKGNDTFDIRTKKLNRSYSGSSLLEGSSSIIIETNVTTNNW